MKNPNYTIIFAAVMAVFGFVISYDWLLFWDTVQFGAKHSLYFYDEGIGNLLLPDEMDSGHPSFFGLYLSLFLQVFGRELWVLHLAMIPITFMIWYYLLAFAKICFYRESYYLVVFVFLSPFVLGHVMLVSPDLVIWAGLLMLFYSHFGSHYWHKVLASVLLCSVSMRGGAVVFSFFFAEMIWRYKPSLTIRELLDLSWNIIKPYLCGVSILLVFLIYHYSVKNWIGYHPLSPWATSFEYVDGSGFFRNIAIFLWKFLDNGMAFIYISTAFFLYKYTWSDRVKMLTIFGLVLMIVLAILVLPYQGLLNDRYFAPLHIVALILLIDQVLYRVSIAFRRVILVPLLILMVSTCFWSYSGSLARAWDVTPMHWSIYPAEKQLMTFLQDEKIPIRSIATAFPLLNTQDHLKLNKDQTMYQNVDLGTNQFILYSPMMNDFSDQEIEILFSKWQTIFVSKNNGLKLTLFKNPNL